MLEPSARSRGARRAVVLLAFVAALAGCSDDAARPPAPAPSTSPPSSGPSPAAGWVTTTDRPTGIRFALPESAQPRRSARPGQGGTRVAGTEYAAQLGDVRLSVSVLTTPSGPAAVRRTVRAQYLPFLVVRAMKSQGAKQAGVVSNTRLRDLPYEGFDSQLTFVRGGHRAVWFTRAVELPRAVVVAQAVAYVPVDEDAVDRVRAEFNRLTDGLEIPS